MNKNALASIIVFSIFLLSAGNLTADIYQDITKVAQQTAQTQLDVITKDIGAVVGAGEYHYGKSLGFPGFDIGIRIPLKNLSDDNVLKNQDTKTITAPAVQAEMGLPAGIDLAVRGLTGGGVNYMGFGIRKSIFENKLIADLGISAMATYNKLSHSYMEITNMGACVSASINLMILKPYVGIGYDTSSLTPGNDAIKTNPFLAGLKGSASGIRYEAGLNISPFPFFYLYGAYAVMYGDPGYTMGAGLKF